jgi:hypothetical protein
MSAVLDDNTAIYVQDDTPNNETQYRARFYVNPNSDKPKPKRESRTRYGSPGARETG